MVGVVQFRALLVVLTASSPWCASGSAGFLRGRDAEPQSWVHTWDVNMALLSVARDGRLGSHMVTDVRLEAIAEALRPIFAALPKTRAGHLDHAAVRYALHRHFEHRYGMYVKGLEPEGEAWNSSSPTEVLVDQVPSYVQHMLERRMKDGLTLKELAIFAATLEHFMHVDVTERLTKSYELAGLSNTELVTTEELHKIMDIYMLHFLSGANYTYDSVHLDSPHTFFPMWPDLQRFTREVQEETLDTVLGSKTAMDARLNFTSAQAVTMAIMERYGSWLDSDCRGMAKDMARLDPEGVGRVKLADFYSLGWQFSETKEYLLDQGSAEEYDVGSGGSKGVRVLIPNYLQARSNCMASTATFTVCCRNQCEDLLRHLERRIAAPTAAPEVILDLVSALPSASVSAPRLLSESLQQRLLDIASAHGGQVPLHGRLFAQFLHHAYPRECPFPALSGTTKPMVSEDWKLANNASATLTRAERAKAIEEDVASFAEQMRVKDLVDGDAESTCAIPWNPEEELYVHQEKQELYVHQEKPTMAIELRVVLRALAMIGAAFSLVFLLFDMVGSGLRAQKPEADKAGKKQVFDPAPRKQCQV